MNKAIVAKWFEATWGEHYDPAVIDQLVDGKILEEIGEEDALRAGLQLGIVRTS